MHVADQFRQRRSGLGLPVTAAASVKYRHHPGPQHIYRGHLPAGLVVVDRYQLMPHGLDSGVGAESRQGGSARLCGAQLNRS
jgi:hypothetical protein